MSDTPETDAFFFRIDIDWDMEVEFARKLERERDEADRSLEKEKIALKYIIKRAIETERDRDDARNMVEKLTEQGLAMMDENRSLKREIKKLKKSSNHKL